jgi:hypothetical protein
MPKTRVALLLSITFKQRLLSRGTKLWKKDKILLTLVDKVKRDEANFKTQSEAQKIEIEDLRKQLAEAKEKCAVAEAKQGISEQWTNHLEKNVEELRIS